MKNVWQQTGCSSWKGEWRKIRLELHQKSSLCQTPSSSLPLLSRVVLCYGLKRKLWCPVLPILYWITLHFSFLPPHRSCHLFLRLKPKRGGLPTVKSQTVHTERFVVSISPRLMFLLPCQLLICSWDDGVTFKQLPCTAGIDFSVVTLVPCPRHTDLISWKWFLPFKFLLIDVGSQFIFLPRFQFQHVEFH